MREVYFLDSFEKWTSKVDCFGKWNTVGDSVTTTNVVRTDTRSLQIPLMGTGLLKGINRLDDSYHCISSGIYIDPGNKSNIDQPLLEISSREGTVLFGDLHLINVRAGVSNTWKLVLEAGTVLGFFPWELNTLRYDTGVTLPKNSWFHLGLRTKFKKIAVASNNYRVELAIKVYINEIEYSWNCELGTGVVSNHLYPDYLFYPRSFTLGNGWSWSTFVINALNIYYDDFYYSKYFLGDLEVGYIDPDGNSTIGWTPSFGENWEAVKKSLHNIDPKVSKLIGSTSTPEVCTLEQPIDVEEVIAVQGVLLGKKDPGSTIKLGTLYGGVVGDNLSMGRSSTIVTDVQDRIPGTTDYWTVEALEDLTFGGLDEH